MELPHSLVEGCHVSGGFNEGIATHLVMIDLRANRIEEGIASYNAVVRLMLGTSLDADWNPRLR